MTHYNDLAAALAQLCRGAGGSREERIATASVLYSTLHHEMVSLARALRREGFEVTVFEDVTHVTLRLDGKSVYVQRFSAQSVIKFEFHGFDPRLIGHEQTTQRVEVSALSLEECAAAACTCMRVIAELWHRDQAMRQDQEHYRHN